MSNTQEPYKRGATGMLHPGATIRSIETAYAHRIGPAFTRGMVRGARLALLGTWTMLGALVLMIAVGVVVYVATSSVGAVLTCMLLSFILIIFGYVIMQIGVQSRARLIAQLVKRILKADPHMTTDAATQLVKLPTRLDVWSANHPGTLRE